MPGRQPLKRRKSIGNPPPDLPISSQIVEIVIAAEIREVGLWSAAVRGACPVHHTSFNHGPVGYPWRLQSETNVTSGFTKPVESQSRTHHPTGAEGPGRER